MNGWLLGGILAWLFGLTVGGGVLMWATSRLYDLVIRLEDKILEQAIQDRLGHILSPPEEGKQDG